MTLLLICFFEVIISTYRRATAIFHYFFLQISPFTETRQFFHMKEEAGKFPFTDPLYLIYFKSYKKSLKILKSRQKVRS